MDALPIDETWILVGMIIFAIAALSQLHQMWREARVGIEDSGAADDVPGAQQYFAAWRAAGGDLGLQVVSTDDEFYAPSLRGSLRGLSAHVEMKLERSDGRRPDPDALNPATVRCPITARLELPFPWRELTVREFVRVDSNKQDGCDDVSRSGGEWPAEATLHCVRLDRRARQALTAMADEFERVTVIGGVLTVVDTVHPSRNTSQWKGAFADVIRNVRGQARALANGGVTFAFEASKPDLPVTMRLEPHTDGLRHQTRLVVDGDAGPPPTIEMLNEQLDALDAEVERRESTGDQWRLEAVLSHTDTEAIEALTRAVFAPASASTSG